MHVAGPWYELQHPETASYYSDVIVSVDREVHMGVSLALVARACW